MRRRWFSRAVRASAVTASGVALAMLLHFDSHPPSPASAAPPAAVAAVPPSNVTAPPREWTVATNGWCIRFADAAQARPQPPPPPQLLLSMSSGPRIRPVISEFDHLIVQHAEAEGFDWRLVAALIAEESGFDPTVRSDKGAYGLMQIMPVAAEAVGADEFASPDQNVRTGVRYLRQLHEVFRAAPSPDRLKLVLAAYNMGPGHVQDAQFVAQALGQDPNRWDEQMELVLPLLEDPEYYDYLPNGYAQGRQTVRFVSKVLDRYERYTHLASRTPGAAVVADVVKTTGGGRTGRRKVRS